jgi:hypothetical protein
LAPCQHASACGLACQHFSFLLDWLTSEGISLSVLNC